MICRLWRGWTTPGNVDAYEAVVRGQVIPGIEARRIDGFLHIDLMRRDLAAIRAFTGEDHEASHVPDAARAALSRFDERAAHYDVIDRRVQDG